MSAALAAVAAPGSRRVLIEGGAVDLEGTLAWPEHPSGTAIVLGEASREGGEPALVARRLREAGIATLSVELPEHAGRKPGIARQLVALAHWIARQPETALLPVGIYGPESLMTAAIAAATLEPKAVAALVVRGTIPRGVHTDLPGLHAATLFLVESEDPRDALRTSAALTGINRETLVVDLRRARPTDPATPYAELAADWTAEWLVEHLALERTWRSPTRR
ncbi:MAG: hypothetical protein ACM357_01625 [Gemmatimonadota bacterium]